nr:MAG TPA: hypothetical protein [Bacteriophage sp.]
MESISKCLLFQKYSARMKILFRIYIEISNLK